jgi:4-hydroxybenzoate polyprenyltransferase
MSDTAAPLYRRLWQYQSERFPVFKHGVLIVAFSSCGVSLSALLRGQNHFPSLMTYGVAFVVMFGLFAQLRIADEHKDADIDARYRPTRPVPRGLISLKELRLVALILAVFQVLACLLLSPMLVALLCVVWAYLGLMTAEFFVPKWLKARPIIYMVSHMLILPLLDLLVTACDWLPRGGVMPRGLEGFVFLSFFNGMIIEIGRKTYAPENESQGVETYSSLWGLNRALSVWMALFCAACASAIYTGLASGYLAIMAVVAGVVSVFAAVVVAQFRRNPRPKAQAQLEIISGIWVLCAYLTLGLLPLVWLKLSA